MFISWLTKGDCPTLTVIVFASAAVISRAVSYAGSVVLGYTLVAVLLSIPHFHAKDSLAILIAVPGVKLWGPKLSTRSPVAAS